MVRARAKSFTLVELVLVVLILALVATLALPALSGGGRRLAARATAYELVWILRQARWHAAAGSEPCWVRLTPDESGGYRAEILSVDTESGPRPVEAAWARSPLLGELDDLIRIPPDRDLATRGELMVRFQPWGVDADYMVRLNDGDRAVRVEVRRPSGLVRLVEDDTPSLLDPDRLADVRNHWRRHCRGAAP